MRVDDWHTNQIPVTGALVPILWQESRLAPHKRNAHFWMLCLLPFRKPTCSFSLIHTSQRPCEWHMSNSSHNTCTGCIHSNTDWRRNRNAPFSMRYFALAFHFPNHKPTSCSSSMHTSGRPCEWNASDTVYSKSTYRVCSFETWFVSDLTRKNIETFYFQAVSFWTILLCVYEHDPSIHYILVDNAASGSTLIPPTVRARRAQSFIP